MRFLLSLLTFPLLGQFVPTPNPGDPIRVLPPPSFISSGQCLGVTAGVWAGLTCSGSTPALTNGHIFVGNASNVATDVAMSGDGTMANTGAITITKSSGVAFGTAAFQNVAAFFQVSNNLSEGTAATMRTNLGLGTAALQNTGTSGATLCLLNASCAYSLTSGTGLPLTGIVNIGANTIVGNNTLSSAAPIALSVAQTNTLLGTVTTSTGCGGDLGGTFPNCTVTTGANLGSTTVPLSALASDSIPINGITCTLGTACAPYGGVNVYTSSHTVNGAGTLNTTDTGKLIVMNCSSSCTLTFESAPAATDWWGVESEGSAVATLSLNGKNFNGTSSVPTPNSFRPLFVGSDGSNYFGDAPLSAGSGMSFAPSAASFTLTSSGGSGSTSLTIANAGTTGTTVNTLTTLTGAPSTAVITPHANTGGIVGITTSGAGTTSNAVVTYAGSASCVFDGATTAGHYFTLSSTVDGDCTDVATPGARQIMGRVLSTNASGGTYTVDLFPSEIPGVGSGLQYASGQYQLNTNVALTRDTYQSGADVYCAGTSGTTSYACAPTHALTGYTTGMHVLFKPDVVSTGAATLNISSLGTSPAIKRQDGSTNPGADFAVGYPYWLVYDGTVFRETNVAGSGAVSSVSNSDGTLTISPTTGAAVASIALGHANSWTALQTLGSNASIAATAHGVLLSENTSAVVATAAGGANFPLIGQASADPVWSTIAYPPSVAAGAAVYASSTTVLAASITPTLGVPGTSTGTWTFGNATGAGTFTLGASPSTTTNTILGPTAAPVTGDVLSCTTASTTCTLTDSGVLAANIQTAASNAVAANQIGVSGGANKATVYKDFPSVLDIPAANCNNATPGAGWSLPASNAPTATCRAGTNNLGGTLNFADAGNAQFDIEIPGDADLSTGNYPYIKLFFTDGANTSGTEIFQAQVSCYVADFSATDDVAFATAQVFTTRTATAANRSGAENLQFNSTSMSGCVAGGSMIVKITRNTDTASSAVPVSKATITIPRLLVQQAN